MPSTLSIERAADLRRTFAGTDHDGGRAGVPPRRSGAFVVDVASDEAAFAALAEEWGALHASMTPRTPFGSPDWSRIWWRHFRRDSFAVRDELRIFTVRDADGGLVAVAPMMLTLRPAVGPFRTRELQFLGADSNMTELRGPVCRAERTTEVAAALARRFAESTEWDWVQWRGLRKGAGAPPVALEDEVEQIDHVLDLPESWDAFRAALPRNIKESLRKCYNSLARDGLDFELAVVETPEEAGPALARFLELHGVRAQTTGTIDHIDVFEKPAAQAFLHEFGRLAAERGELRVFELRIGGAVVATRIGFLLGQELYLYYSGYDVAFGRYSVMTTAVAEAIRWAIGRGLGLVNLSTGTDVSKTRWRPRPVLFAGGRQTAPTWRAEIAVSAVESLRRRTPVWVGPAGPARLTMVGRIAGFGRRSAEPARLA